MPKCCAVVFRNNPRSYTYAIPDDMMIERGDYVLAPTGVDLKPAVVRVKRVFEYEVTEIETLAMKSTNKLKYVSQVIDMDRLIKLNS
jgi:hypothetical protein